MTDAGESSEPEPFWIPAGVGCEHIAVAKHPKFGPVAVTVRTESRHWRRADSEGLGFAFMGLVQGKPQLLSVQPPATLRRDGEPVGHTWMGVATHTKGPLAEGGFVLAATAKSGRYDGKASKPMAMVEFFTWDLSVSTPKLKRCVSRAMPTIKDTEGDDFNAIMLAGNGDVYVSKFGKLFGRLEKASFATGPDLPEVKKLRGGSIYLSRGGTAPWVEVASGIPGVNGLYLSGDEKQLAVNAYVRDKVLVLQRDAATGLLSGPETITLNGGPDNLSWLSPTKTVALTTPKLGALAALVGGGVLGSTLGIRPSAQIWELDVTQPTSPARRLLEIPRGNGLFSVATKFGDWWLCGQIMGPDIYCIPARSR